MRPPERAYENRLVRPSRKGIKEHGPGLFPLAGFEVTTEVEAIYPKPRLSTPAPGHRIYPYQLRGLRIDRPNMVWAMDITYIRLLQGFIYLVAIMDWCSRYPLAWAVSTSMDSGFCVAALDWALTKAQP